MKIINYIFFNIFNTYYKDGNYKNDIPWVTALAIIVVAITFYTIFIVEIIDHYIFRNSYQGFPLPEFVIFLIGGIYAVIAYFLFCHKQKYLKIYNEFKKQEEKNKIGGRIVAWGFVIMSICTIAIPVILWHH